MKLLPVIVTLCPPVTGLAVGLTATTARPRYVKHPAQRPLPAVPAVTTTSVAPAVVAAGAVPVIVVALTTCRLRTSLPPIVTPVAPERFLPVIVTAVPPTSGPLAGLTASTTGAGAELVESEHRAMRNGTTNTKLR
jgi:hypothetical protein